MPTRLKLSCNTQVCKEVLMFKKFLLCVGCLFTINICVSSAEAQLPLLLRALAGRTATGAVTRGIVTRGIVRRGLTRTPDRRATPNPTRYIRRIPTLSGLENSSYESREYRTYNRRVYPLGRQTYYRSNRTNYAPRYVPRNVPRYVPRRVITPLSCW